jgi:uncharacterized alkaline shock family protein YloU
VPAGYYSTVASATDPSGGRAGGGEIDRDTLARSVRSAASECYGVRAVAPAGWFDRLAGWFRPGHPRGIAVALDGNLRVTLDLRVAAHVPVAQVAANVSEAVRYRVLRDFGRAIDELIICIDGRPVPSGPIQPPPGSES